MNHECVDGHSHDFKDLGLNLAECRWCGLVVMHGLDHSAFERQKPKKVIVYPYDVTQVRRHSARRLIANDALTSLFYRYMLRRVRYGSARR